MGNSVSSLSIPLLFDPGWERYETLIKHVVVRGKLRRNEMNREWIFCLPERLDFIMLRSFSREDYICYPVQWKPDSDSSICKELSTMQMLGWNSCRRKQACISRATFHFVLLAHRFFSISFIKEASIHHCSANRILSSASSSTW